MTTLVTPIRHNQYGNFNLTKAVRPYEALFTPREGYRLENYRDPFNRRRTPMLAASVSSEHLFDVFLDLLEPLGDEVHVVLETSHQSWDDHHDDLRRCDIDKPVLASHFCDFEELLLNDGCTGVAVIANDRPIEVQLDEHKLLFVYARDLKPFRRILRFHDVRRREHLPLIAETEHLHYSTPDYADDFRQLCCRVGAGDFDSVFSDENGWAGR